MSHRQAMRGFARGNIVGGVLFTWVVAQQHPMLALIGVAAAISARCARAS
jgi:hypothetical protein